MSGLISGLVGIQTQAAQPGFSAISDAVQTNITGTGTLATLVFGGTETFDQNADFDGTSTFTAPVTGRYLLMVQLNTGTATAANTTYSIQIVTGNRTYHDGKAFKNIYEGYYGATIRQVVIADMDASDTALCKFWVYGELSNVTDTAVQGTYFMGWLMG